MSKKVNSKSSNEKRQFWCADCGNFILHVSAAIHRLEYHEVKVMVLKCDRHLCNHIEVRHKAMQMHLQYSHGISRNLTEIAKINLVVSEPYEQLQHCWFCHFNALSRKEMEEHVDTIHDEHSWYLQ